MPVTHVDFPLNKLTRSTTEEDIQRNLARERARLASMMGLDSGPVRHFQRPVERPFTPEERGKVTILFGGLTWKHERVIQAVFEGCGYRCEVMQVPDVEGFQLGKEYGNNGQCNPTYFTVGNLVKHLQGLESRGLTKHEIINNYIFFTAGSCGPCRFGMYESEYRLALQNAGFDGFRVLLFQQNDGVKAASGEARLKFTVDFGMGMFNALNLGDIMNEMVYRVRPYEVEKGKTDRGFHESIDALCTMLRERKPFEDHEDLPGWMAERIKAHKGEKWEIWVNSLLKVREQLYGNPYKDALQEVHDQIGTIEVDRLRVKPVVKIIGEFWAQITEGDGNFHMFEFLEREGAQVLVEPIGTWVMYMMYQVKARAAARRSLDAPYKHVKPWELHKLAKNELKFRQKQWMIGMGERVYARQYHRVVEALGDVAHHLIDQKEMAELANPFYNEFARGGEGHLEVGKNVYYTKHRLCHMVLALKPFGCMPSSQSDGVQSAVANHFKEMIFLPIETSGEGEINAHSRVQMALGEAKVKARMEFEQVLESTGKRLDDIKHYVAEHPELRNLYYPVPHREGVTGIAANFVLHVNDLMNGRARLKRLPAPVPGKLAVAAAYEAPTHVRRRDAVRKDNCTMPEVEVQRPGEAAPTHRLDVQLHELLMKPPDQPRLLPLPPSGKLKTLPEAVFPQHPELMDLPDEDFFPKDGKRNHKAKYIYRAVRGWAFPFIRSRALPGEFHPIIAYLFNEWKCNLDCHYCWAFDNSVRGMTEDTAKRSIDWLRDTGAGVLALMGGEPLLRPDFAHKIIYYAVKKGFWVYLPTNGHLLWPKVIDKIADAGVGTVNLAVDAWDDVPGRGLPKAMVPIRSHFDYLVKKQYKYGYSVFLNINICANNMDDVRQLTELAHDNGIATDYHICESPMTEQPQFKHLYSNPTFICEEDHPKVAELVDWLIEKQKSGYHMVNSIERLAQMKNFIHGDLHDWNCRAGHNSLIVRVDGTLAPCFPMYSATYDWGTIENHKFETKQLKEIKKECQKNCFSTLNHILAFCYNDRRVIQWLFKQAKHGFRRVEGNFGD